MSDEKVLDLEAVEARANAAAPGPWMSDGAILIGPDRRSVARYFTEPGFIQTMTFIAASRTDVPALVAEVKRLRDRIDVAQAALEDCRRHHIDPRDHEEVIPRTTSTVNAQDDRDALETATREIALDFLEGVGERVNPETGEVFDEDAPAGSGWDSERHCATDLRGADWAGRKLREAQEQIALTRRMHEAEIAALDRKMEEARDRYRTACLPFARTAEYMENVLRVFASTPEGKAEVLKGLRTKSRLLPSGVRIGWEKKGGQLRLQEVPDAREKLIRWARLHCPDATEQRWEVDAAAAKKHYAKTFGRVGAPDGMERVPESEELYVSTGVETKTEES